MSIAESPAQVRKRTDAEIKLIAAAADLLGEVGPRAMSVRMVAERAGVNHGLVHHYFGSKEGLTRAAMLQLVEQHAADVNEKSRGNPIPLPLALNEEPRYLRAVVRAVLDGEMELATTELEAGVSIPRGALQHVAKMRQLDEPDTQTKALAAIGMALEMGWAALEPFIFSVADVQGKEQEQVREIVRTFRNSLITDFMQ
jgi:AcrR family transcriptional regulator